MKFKNFSMDFLNFAIKIIYINLNFRKNFT